ncbi:MAG: hypothetical protein QM706_19020 [Nitrospira sp.]
MTKYWPTLLMCLVLAALGGYLYLVEFSRQAARGEAGNGAEARPFFSRNRHYRILDHNGSRARRI